MSDNQEQAMESAISQKLDGVDLSSPEAQMLSAQLAKELGLDLDNGPQPSPEQKAMLGLLEDRQPQGPMDSPVEEPVQEAQYKYTRDDGTVKEFADRESYLEYKIGADANKWANKFKELEAKVNQGEQPKQTQPAQRPEELLFEESVLKNEEWSPVVQVMTKAFERFYALQNQELQGKFDALNNQFGELKMSATESAVRSEFGIDRATEQEILEKQPSVVRDSLAKLDPTARLAVIRQLKGQTEAATQAKPTMPRAVPPQQAHVESSARGEPDYDRANAVESKLWDMSESDRDKAFGKLFESSGIFK